MSFVIMYSLILASISTLSFAILSCSYCYSHCYNIVEDEVEEMPASVRHIYS